jgi:integrase
MTTTAIASPDEPEEPKPPTRTPRKRRGRRANGEGTIYARKDGRFEAKVYVTTPHGERVRKPLYGKTYEEVHEKLTEILANEHRGIPMAGTSLTVAEYLTYWIEEVATHRVRPTTMVSYNPIVRKHLIPGLGKKRLDRLSPKDVRAWLNRFRNSCLCCSLGKDTQRTEMKRRCCAKPGGACCKQRPSDRTVRYALVLLRAALDHAMREELIARNVAKLVEIRSGHREEFRPWTLLEAKTFLNSLRDDRLFAFYALALGLGLRRGEALGLHWSDVDLSGGQLQIRQTLQRIGGQLVRLDTKTQRSRRVVALPEPVVRALRQHKARQNEDRLAAGVRWQETGYVFTTRWGTPIEPRNINRHFARACKEAGIRKIRVHDLRHTCATLLRAQGTAAEVVSDLLGHADVRITLDIYTHVDLDRQRSEVDRLRNMFDL